MLFLCGFCVQVFFLFLVAFPFIIFPFDVQKRSEFYSRHTAQFRNFRQSLQKNNIPKYSYLLDIILNNLLPGIKFGSFFIIDPFFIPRPPDRHPEYLL